MAGHWSSETVVAEYRDVQANAMAVNSSGHLALLAGWRALVLVNLNQRLESVKTVARQSKWKIIATQWNPHELHSHLFAIGCNRRADICCWDGSKISPQGSLHAHTRGISDLDWSYQKPELLATCSIDSYTYIWNINDCRRPSVTLQAVAGVSQVKWNCDNSGILATTHDGDIRIWDPRKGVSPVQYISAHPSKINGLDWNPNSAYHLATCSQDSTIKFWDIRSPRLPERKLPSRSPVWRARYTPFGLGLVTVVVSQWRRGESCLFLWNLNDLSQPVHTFVGHTDVVLEFQWRRPEQDREDYQLVTWSLDQSLRLWRVEPHLQELCGHVVTDAEDVTFGLNSASSTETLSSQPEMPPPSTELSLPAKRGRRVSLPRKCPHAKSQPGSPAVSGSGKKEEIPLARLPPTLRQEFNLLNFYIPNVTVEQMDSVKRTCTVSVVSGKQLVKLTMQFPDSYPDNEPPSFQFGRETTINKTSQEKLIKVLRDTSLHNVKHSLSCIEPCLRQLVSSLDSLTLDEQRSPEGAAPPYNLPAPSPNLPPPPAFLPIYTYGAMQDVSVPFPRTSGARFCAFGTLVCFTRQTDVHICKKHVTQQLDPTPRAMSALSEPQLYSQAPGPATPFSLYNSGRSPPSDSTISTFYMYMERQHSTRSKSRSKEIIDSRMGRDPKTSETEAGEEMRRHQTGPVVIYDISCLLPLSKQLAEAYVLDSCDVPSMCQRNATVAAACGRMDLVQVWSLAALASDDSLKANPDPDKGSPWAVHPFGRKLFKSLIDHYCQTYDIQTLAMLCCAFGFKYDPQKALAATSIMKSTSDYNVAHHYNAYHTIHPTDTTLKGWNYTLPRIRRSNSWSSQLGDDCKFVDTTDAADIEKEEHAKNMSVLDECRISQYDQFKMAYGDILYRWGLLNTRAEILKYVSTPAYPHKGLEFNAACQHCHQEVRGAQCYHCKNYVLQCVICHITVKGSSSFCLACGHGGHSYHMIAWFKSHPMCPTGCGCHCLDDNPMTNSIDEE